MKSKLFMGALVFLMLVNIATLGSFLYFRWKNHPPAPPPVQQADDPGLRLPPLMDQLTPEQREKLGDLVRKFRDDTKPAAEAIRSTERRLFDQMMDSTAAKESVYATMQSLANLRAEMGKKAIDRLLESKQVLTPAQREIFFRAIMSPGRPQGGPPEGGRGLRDGIDPRGMMEGPPLRQRGMRPPRGRRPPPDRPPGGELPPPPPDDGPPDH